MNTLVKPYLKRASLLAGLAVLLGLLLSAAVYYASSAVKKNAVDLVENRIPVLTNIKQLIADLNEQERIVYEYYATQDSTQFWKSYNNNNASLILHTFALANHPNFSEQLEMIRSQTLELENLIYEFHRQMQLEQVDWDKLREILQTMSSIRRNILPYLNEISAMNEQKVAIAHQQTLVKMALAHKLVVVYGVSILALALVIAWYIKQYVIANGKITRLALFPQHNPHPILSVNYQGQVIFSNPACQIMLQQCNLAVTDLTQLVPLNFEKIRDQLQHNNQRSINVEQSLGQKIVQMNINWLPELNAYDIHIMDITERKLAEQKINDLAFYNQESKLPNRYKLDQQLNLCLQAKHQFALELLEIRDFSQIVTAHGIDAAVEVSTEVAYWLRQRLTNYQLSEQVYQLANNQFALLYVQQQENNIEMVNQHLSTITKQAIITDCGEFFIELDAGVCCFPEHGETLDVLYKNAHTALMKAKADQHINLVYFQQSFALALQNQQTLLEKLRHAVAENELFLVFQPQLDIQSNQITGLETLVRWRHQQQIVSPADFIPLAEQSGLIVDIGEWILKQACQFAKTLTQLYPQLIVAVNVSPRQFSHPKFLQTVKLALDESGLLPAHLELEITEGVVMHQESDVIERLQQLKSLGIQLSIDDFGTGYSSLSYLKQFPVDKLKIDQSFIRECHKNDEDKALVCSVISLGKSLGLKLIAEGVELESHLKFLQQQGCNEIQGYWFSKPLEQQALLTFMAQFSAKRKADAKNITSA